MTMFWHDQKVALRIVDDVSGADFNPDDYPDYRVIEVTSAQVDDYDTFAEIAENLELMLYPGRDLSYKTPEWRAKNRRLHEELMVGSPWGGFIG